MLTFLFLGLASLVCLPFFIQIVSYRLFHPLSKFPGPFWASVTRIYATYYSLKGIEHEHLLELHRRHGAVIRYTPTMLSVSDATKLPVLYTRYADKTQHYITGSFGKTESVFNMQNHAQHARFRKVLAGPYSFSNVKKMEPLLDARINQWTAKLVQNFAKTGASFDFAPWAVYMAYDIISEIGFGAAFGFIEKGEDLAGLIQGFHDGLPLFGLLARLYPFTNWIKSTWVGKKYLVAKPEDESGIGILMRFRDKLILERLDEQSNGKAPDRVDLLQTFLDARDDDGKSMKMDWIKAEVLLVLLAGADTTGTAFQGLMHMVMSNPPIYEKLLAEIDEATLAGRISEMPQYEEVIKYCPYYVACVKETMRLYPSAPNIFPRLVGNGGVELYGKHVPEGIEVTCNPWVVHRDPNIYSTYPNDFNPERWLDNNERAKDYDKYNMGFGYGARVCLGRDIALMEMYKAPLHFFRTFRPEVLDPTDMGQFVVKGGVAYWTNMWMKISERLIEA